MINAPDVILNIIDIQQIYAINEKQSEDLDEAIDRLNKNLYVDEMDEDTISRYESLFGLTAGFDDTIEDRRFNIKTQIGDRYPNSYNGIIRKLDRLLGEGQYSFTVNSNRSACNVRIKVDKKSMKDSIFKLLDEIIPLNMTINVDILYNSNSQLRRFKHSQMTNKTHDQLREELIN